MFTIAAWAMSASCLFAQTPSSDAIGYYVLQVERGEHVYLNAHADICLDPEVATSQTLPNELRGEALKRLVSLELQHTTEFFTILRRQNAELVFYKHTHTKKDKGYKEVISFAKKHKEKIEVVANNIKSLKKAQKQLERRSSLQKMEATLHTTSLHGKDNKGTAAPNGSNAFLPLTTGNKEGCNYGLAMKQLFAPDENGVHSDSKGNIFCLKKSKKNPSAVFGERFGTDGSYFKGYFNTNLKRQGEGFGVDTTLVKCGDWNDDAYIGQNMLHHAERIYGLDISRYEHDKSKPVKVQVKAKTADGKDTLKTITTSTVDIDWSDLRITHLGTRANQIEGKVNYPVDFIFIKCSEGRDWLNRYYNADLDSCLAHHIPVSAYHFYSHKSSAKDQAANFVKNGRLNENTMRPMLDIEPSESQLKAMGGIHELLKGMVIFIDEVEKATGRSCVLYLNQSFVRNYWHLFPERLKQCDIWLAKYHQNHPYTKFLIWQFADNGKVKGIIGDVDLNVFNGSRKDFDKWRKQK